MTAVDAAAAAVAWATTVRPAATRRQAAQALLRIGLLAAGLLLCVGGRWAASVSAAGDALVVGAAFGLGLWALAVVAGWRPTRPGASPALIGLAGGAALVVLATTIRATAPIAPLAPESAFVPWAAITIVVAAGEEAVLRGVLFDAAARPFGEVAAVLATAALFALMHVPLYGWHVVPLDLGVGLLLGGLRLLSGGPGAPAIAHVLADLATWWL